MVNKTTIYIKKGEVRKDPEDVEMLQDMVAAAVNEALRGVSEISSQRLNAATGGLNIPGLM